MLKFEKSIIVNRPVEAVWKFMTNFENFPKWDRGVLEVRQISEGPTDVGSVLQSVRLFLVIRGRGTIRVSEYAPNKMLGFEGSQGSVSGKFRFTFEPVGGGTRITEVREVELGGLWKLLTPIIIPMQEKQGRDDLACIKRIMEDAA